MPKKKTKKIIPIKVESYIGRKGVPSGQDWVGTIKSQKIIKKSLTSRKEDDILLVYFEENDFCCNVEIVKFEEE